VGNLLADCRIEKIFNQPEAVFRHKAFGMKLNTAKGTSANKAKSVVADICA